ncbi:pseudouridylate synthase [Marchantia polymorpha subsp. ruderalis]
MLKAGELSDMFASRIATIRRHIAPRFLSARSSHANVESLERLGIRIEPNVRKALSEGLPVVALESTIISHGMPYPQNLSTAKEVESVVKQHGATPATIAILNGVPCIGLTEEELEFLAQCGSAAAKTSRRDIAQVISRGVTGATTVSATMFFAAKAGIHVFVTGGIGGVHRLGESTLDISSDLTELGRTPVVVVCAGVKSILDIPRTLEYLETQGVTVVSYGTEEFPAFFTSKSGCKAPCRVDSPEQCAAIAESNLKLELQSGILIAVPIPDQHSAAAEHVETAIQTALQEMREKNVQGNAVTPFLLKRVNELTGGDSLASNIELIKNNARVGAQISVALQEKMR